MDPSALMPRTETLGIADNAGGASDPVMAYGDNVERQLTESITKSRPTEKQYSTAAKQEVFHIARPLIANVEKTNSKPPNASYCDTVMAKSNLVAMKQTEIVAPINVQSVSTSSNGQLSGYRNKQSLIPVNSQTAILLPRPQHSVTIANMGQRIPVLNNTQFHLPRHAPIDNKGLSSILSQSGNNNFADINLQHSSHAFWNTSVGSNDGIIEKRSRQQASDNVFVSSLNLCRNKNSRVRNTAENDAWTQEEVKSSDNKLTDDDDVHKSDNVSDGLQDKTNFETFCPENVKNEPMDAVPEQIDKVKDNVNESACPPIMSDTDDRNNSLLNQYITVKTENDIADTTLRDSRTNFPTTSNYLVGEHTRQPVQKNYYITDLSTSVSKTEQSHANNIIQNASMANITDTSLDESDASRTDNLTDTINRVASGEAILTFPSNYKKKSNRASKKAKETETHNAETSKAGAEDTVKPSSTKKIQQSKELSVKLFQSKQPIKKNSKAYLDMEARYIGHELTEVSSFEEVFENESDIINKIESDKLTKVKDHHLLKLSDMEREYLRNKCYLGDDLTYVRHRFEAQPRTINESCNNKSPSDGDNYGASSLSESSNERRNDKGMKFEQQLENVEKEIPTKVRSESNVKSRQPVVKLQRLESIPSVNQSYVSANVDKLNNTSTIPQAANNTSTSRKVYYVINSNDIVRLQQPAHGTISANNMSYKMSATGSRSGTSNSTVTLAVTAHLTTPTIAQVSVSPNNTDLNLKSIPRKQMNVSQIDSTSGRSMNLTQNGEFELKSSQACENLSLPERSNKQYSNKFTVKELLKAKREDKNCGSASRQIKPMTSIPVQLYGRAIYGNPLKATFVTQNKIMETPTHLEMPASASNSTGAIITENSLITAHQQINQSVLTKNPERIPNIVNPSVILPVSTIEHSNMSTAVTNTHSTSIKPVKVISTQGSYVSSTLTTELQSEAEKRRPVYIKIGDQTMIVKRCESRCSAERKTLPAPKPKHSFTDDYKKKRRRSKFRHTHRTNHKCLRTKLRNLLQRSDESVQKLMDTLDLVPVELLKNFTDTKVKEEAVAEECVTSNTSNITLASTNQDIIVSAQPTIVDTENGKVNTKSRKRKLSCNNPANMANILQINKRKDGKIEYGNHQVKVRYTKARSTESRDSGSLCRLKFSVEGHLMKIYIESLRQGLYLVQNCKGDKTHLKNNRKVDVFLVLYPPHIATIPEGSLCIAVGDLFSQEQRNKYKFDTESTDVQKVLEQFLCQISMENIDDFMDKRYSSVTDRSMSPRCSSPMFYSPEMKDAFELYENGASYDISTGYFSVSASVSRRIESAVTNPDIMTTRFSERAMALKIKQNELFETCRRLKSERTAKEGNKKKREIPVESDTTKNETTQNELIEGVRVLGPEVPEQDIFNDELRYCSISNS